MNDPSDRVRREEEDWPPPDKINLDLLQRLFSGKEPWPQFNPTKDIEQAVKLAHQVAEDRTFNFELIYRRSLGSEMLREWESRFAWMNWPAAAVHDYANAVESYWAFAKTPALAICRGILNILDGVQEKEY